MKHAAWIVGLCLALGLMVAPSAAAVDAAEVDAAVDAEENCTRDVPPSYCKIGPVVCSFQGDVGCSLEKAATASADSCQLQYPPSCEAGPVTCNFEHPPSADDCHVDLEPESTSIPPPCFVDETVEAGETSVRVTLGHCPS